MMKTIFLRRRLALAVVPFLTLAACTSTPPVAERTVVTTYPAGSVVGERQVVLRTVGYRPGYIDPYYTGSSYRDRTLFGAP